MTERRRRGVIQAPPYGTAVTIGLAILVAGGCGSSTPMIPVGGRVTIDGEPVTNGTITFHPDSGRPASGALGEGGVYRLTSVTKHDGVPPGRYVVTINARRPAASAQQFESIEDELRFGEAVAEGRIKPEVRPPATANSRVEWIVPEKYSRAKTSGLTADVAADTGGIDFDLKSSP